MFGNRRKGWIGIEWGTQTLRLAQVERCHGELRIVASAIVSRYGDFSASQKSLSAVPSWSAQELQTAIRSNPCFSGRRAACVLPMHLTELRQLTIPPANDAERYAMVSNEIALAHGETEEDLVFDYWNASAASPDASESVNAMSASGSLVEKMTQTLAQAGLECEALDGLPFSLSRAVGFASGRENAPVAVLNWGIASSMFCLVQNSEPLFTRHLRNCGLADLLEAVGKTLALPEEDVLDALATYGLPSGSSPNTRSGEI
jgi:Tfp pilus assembly PilM family ATPase